MNGEKRESSEFAFHEKAASLNETALFGRLYSSLDEKRPRDRFSHPHHLAGGMHVPDIAEGEFALKIPAKLKPGDRAQRFQGIIVTSGAKPPLHGLPLSRAGALATRHASQSIITGKLQDVLLLPVLEFQSSRGSFSESGVSEKLWSP